MVGFFASGFAQGVTFLSILLQFAYLYGLSCLHFMVCDSSYGQADDSGVDGIFCV